MRTLPGLTPYLYKEFGWSGRDFRNFIFATAKNTKKKQKIDRKSKIWSVKIRETYILLTSPSFVQNAPVEVVVEFWRSFRHKKSVFFSGIRLLHPNYNWKPDIPYVKSTSPGWEIGENWIFFVEEGRQSSTTTPPDRFG